MNKKRISKQFSSDLERIIEGCQIDSTLIANEDYQKSINTANLLIAPLSQPTLHQKQEIKSKVYEKNNEKQSLGYQIKENIYFYLVGVRKSSMAAAVLLGLCILLLSPPVQTFAKYIHSFYREWKSQYRIGNIIFNKVEYHDEYLTASFDKEDWLVIKEMQKLPYWEYTTKVQSYYSRVNAGQSPEVKHFKNIEEGKKALYFDIKVPTYMPSNATFREMVITPIGLILLVYDTPTGGIDISERRAPNTFYKQEGRYDVTETPKAISLKTTDAGWLKNEHSLIWEYDGLSFSIHGDITSEEAAKMANSMK